MVSPKEQKNKRTKEQKNKRTDSPTEKRISNELQFNQDVGKTLQQKAYLARL